jgi:hypothetical protein
MMRGRRWVVLHQGGSQGRRKKKKIEKAVTYFFIYYLLLEIFHNGHRIPGLEQKRDHNVLRGQG